MTKRLLLVSLSVAWVAALLCVTEVLAAGSCGPDCRGKNPMDKVTDPLNCTKYYLCMGDDRPADASAPCPAGTAFDASASPPDCTGALPCEPSCRLPPCHLTCDGNPDTISDPTSCNNYYICSEDIIIGPLECPNEKPYFDGEACGVDNGKCCGDMCIAYCYPGLVQVSDPYDCHKFFLCSKEGPADELYHFNCPAGTNFVVAESDCVIDAPCNTLCGVTTTAEPTTYITATSPTTYITATSPTIYITATAPTTHQSHSTHHTSEPQHPPHITAIAPTTHQSHSTHHISQPQHTSQPQHPPHITATAPATHHSHSTHHTSQPQHPPHITATAPTTHHSHSTHHTSQP